MGSVKTSINQDLNCTRSLLLPTQLVWPHKATQHTPRMHKLKYVAVIVHKLKYVAHKQQCSVYYRHAYLSLKYPNKMVTKKTVFIVHHLVPLLNLGILIKFHNMDVCFCFPTTMLPCG